MTDGNSVNVFPCLCLTCAYTLYQCWLAYCRAFYKCCHTLFTILQLFSLVRFIQADALALVHLFSSCVFHSHWIFHNYVFLLLVSFYCSPEQQGHEHSWTGSLYRPVQVPLGYYCSYQSHSTGDPQTVHALLMESVVWELGLGTAGTACLCSATSRTSAGIKGWGLVVDDGCRLRLLSFSIWASLASLKHDDWVPQTSVLKECPDSH